MQNRILTFATIALLAAQLTTGASSATRAELVAERRLELESRTEAAAGGPDDGADDDCGGAQHVGRGEWIGADSLVRRAA